MGHLLDLVQAEHRCGSFDRMSVAEERIDRVGLGAARFEREQRVDDVVEARRGLVPEEFEELGPVFGHAAPSATASNTTSMSTMPTRSPSARVEPTRNGDSVGCVAPVSSLTSVTWSMAS